MSDDVLRRTLRVVDSAMRPRPTFVDELHASLATELGLDGGPTSAGRVRVPARTQVRRRGRVGWLAVAALLVLSLLALLIAQQGRTPDVPPPPSGSPSDDATYTPSLEPSQLPSPSASTAPAAPEPSPALDNLRSDGMVVYESGARGGLQRLRVVQPDLSSIELLPDFPDVQFGAAWRPDGQRLAFASYDPLKIRSHRVIWETDARGRDPVLLSEGCDLPACSGEVEPSYSPDGTRLVFVRTRVRDGFDEESVVAIRDLETGVVTELEATSRPRRTGEPLHPRWSPDGQTIAYGVSEYDEFGFAGASTLHLIDADGTDDRVIGAPDLYAGDPEWSLDGQTILFSSNPFRPKLRAFGGLDEPYRLGIMGADGSNAWLFDFGPSVVSAVAASWSGTGDQILFTLMDGDGTGPNIPTNWRLFVMDPDGSNVLPVTRSPGNAVFAVQQPSP